MPTKPTDTRVAEIERLFAQRGESMYAGEPVTQTEHALQCAWQAEQQQAGSAMIVAALLHDVGHLLHEMDENCAEQGIDDQHEVLGMRWLDSSFSSSVCAPVGLHVTAKRYRCAVDAEYHSRLSDASKLSLKLQGGPLSGDEVSQFEQDPFFEQALQLREWDEAAKIPGLQPPALAHFLTYVSDQLQEGK